MKKEELAALIDSFGRDLPAQITGNEENIILSSRMADLVQTERSMLVELLHDWLSVRIPQSERQSGDGVKEGRIWLALEVAKKYTLSELRLDIETLIVDVRSGKTFLPYYADMIAKYRFPIIQQHCK